MITISYYYSNIEITIVVVIPGHSGSSPKPLPHAACLPFLSPPSPVAVILCEQSQRGSPALSQVPLSDTQHLISYLEGIESGCLLWKVG